jgi:hypothetical protein
MHRGLKVSHCPPLAAWAAALGLALTLAWTGAALAGGPYTVKVKVKPSSVLVGSNFTVAANGVSANLSQLKVFLNRTKKCASTATADAAISSDSLKINDRVSGTYSKARTLTAANVGGHYACAYLTAASKRTSAYASAYYRADLPFY